MSAWQHNGFFCLNSPVASVGPYVFTTLLLPFRLHFSITFCGQASPPRIRVLTVGSRFSLLKPFSVTAMLSMFNIVGTHDSTVTLASVICCVNWEPECIISSVGTNSVAPLKNASQIVSMEASKASEKF